MFTQTKDRCTEKTVIWLIGLVMRERDTEMSLHSRYCICLWRLQNGGHLQYHLETGRAARAADASAPVHHIARYVIVRAAHQTAAAAAAARWIIVMLVRMHGMRLMDMYQLLMGLLVLMRLLLVVMQVMLMEDRTGGHGSFG